MRSPTPAFLRSMGIRLVDDWHRILFRAWSVRLMLLGFAFQVLEALLPYFDPDSYGIPPDVFRFATIAILVGAAWARISPQPQSLPEKQANADQQN